MGLSAGGVFGAVVISIFTPLSIYFTGLFYNRNDCFPIKQRSPLLVVITDVVLILYVMLLCFQRIFDDTYPCWLNLWSAYIGTIVLFNTYMWRCWTLYYQYNVNEERLALDRAAASDKPADNKDLPFFIRNRRFSQSDFLFKLAMGITIILMIPCFAMTGTDSSVRTATGIFKDQGGVQVDACDLGWAQTLLAVYVAGYVLAFSFFAWGLRAVEDGYKIKDELRLTGVIGIAAVIPWLLFNRVESLRDINNKTFPVSTLFLIIAVVAAWSLSTLWPLVRSYQQPQTGSGENQQGEAKVQGAQDQAQQQQQNVDIDSLESIVLIPVGFEAFRKFLSAEFSVENLLFWKDIEDFRKKIKANANEDFIRTENKRLYEKYIIEDSPFQVNLKGEVVQRIKAVVEGGAPLPQVGAAQDEKVEGGAPKKRLECLSPAAAETPTVFDESQANIFKLMKTDSFPRFKTSDIYTAFAQKMGKGVEMSQV